METSTLSITARILRIFRTLVLLPINAFIAMMNGGLTIRPPDAWSARVPTWLGWTPNFELDDASSEVIVISRDPVLHHGIHWIELLNDHHPLLGWRWEHDFFPDELNDATNLKIATSKQGFLFIAYEKANSPDSGVLIIRRKDDGTAEVFDTIHQGEKINTLRYNYVIHEITDLHNGEWVTYWTWDYILTIITDEGKIYLYAFTYCSPFHFRLVNEFDLTERFAWFRALRQANIIYPYLYLAELEDDKGQVKTWMLFIEPGPYAGSHLGRTLLGDYPLGDQYTNCRIGLSSAWYSPALSYNYSELLVTGTSDWLRCYYFPRLPTPDPDSPPPSTTYTFHPMRCIHNDNSIHEYLQLSGSPRLWDVDYVYPDFPAGSHPTQTERYTPDYLRFLYIDDGKVFKQRLVPAGNDRHPELSTFKAGDPILIGDETRQPRFSCWHPFGWKRFTVHQDGSVQSKLMWERVW